MNHFPEEVGVLFQLDGQPLSSVPFGNGNVNDTFLLSCEKEGKLVRYTAQRINHDVFKDPEGLMENFSRVTEHLSRKTSGSPRKSLRLIPAKDGRSFARDKHGNYWRVLDYVDRSACVEVPDSPEQAYEAARSFGEFQALLADLPGGPLRETIPDFHHTRKRLDRFRQVVADDPVGRVDQVRDLLAFIVSRESLADLLVDLIEAGKLPLRIVHNDTKINNVLLDKNTGKGLCVVDLDTVMSGCSLHDFGDLVRTAACSAEEDEVDPSKIRFLPETYDALVKGYLETAGSFLTPEEIEHLPVAPHVITFELGIRFLTDYVEGDIYFKRKWEDHNLVRARAQFALLESMEAHEAEMQATVNAYAKSTG